MAELRKKYTPDVIKELIQEWGKEREEIENRARKKREEREIAKLIGVDYYVPAKQRTVGDYDSGGEGELNDR